jgi:hypothetical protein
MNNAKALYWYVVLMVILTISAPLRLAAQGTGPNCTVVKTTDTQLPPQDGCFGANALPGNEFHVTHGYTAECHQLTASGDVDNGPATPSSTTLQGVGICGGGLGPDCGPGFSFLADTVDSTVQWAVQNYSSGVKPGLCEAADVTYSDLLSCQPTFGTCPSSSGGCSGAPPCSGAICNANNWSCPSGVSCKARSPSPSCMCDLSSNTWFCPKPPNVPVSCNTPQPNDTCVCNGQGAWVCDCTGSPGTCPDGTSQFCQGFQWTCGCPGDTPQCCDDSDAICTMDGWSCSVICPPNIDGAAVMPSPEPSHVICLINSVKPSSLHKHDIEKQTPSMP